MTESSAVSGSSAASQNSPASDGSAGSDSSGESSASMAATKRVNGVHKPQLATKLVSARPIRSNRAGEKLAATLESLGADPVVVEAAKKG